MRIVQPTPTSPTSITTAPRARTPIADLLAPSRAPRDIRFLASRHAPLTPGTRRPVMRIVPPGPTSPTSIATAPRARTPTADLLAPSRAPRDTRPLASRHAPLAPGTHRPV